MLNNFAAMRKHPPRILVSDFDGTMTKYDFFDLARRELPSAADHDFWQDYVAGKITHFEALAGLVRPGRRFATGWLAQHLKKNGDFYRPSTSWSQIAEALLEEKPC